MAMLNNQRVNHLPRHIPYRFPAAESQVRCWPQAPQAPAKAGAAGVGHADRAPGE